jgi:hypothetical protein
MTDQYSLNCLIRISRRAMYRGLSYLLMLFAMTAFVPAFLPEPAAAQEPAKDDIVTIQGRMVTYIGGNTPSLNNSKVTPTSQECHNIDAQCVYAIADEKSGDLYALLFNDKVTVTFGVRYKITGLIVDHKGKKGYQQTFTLQVRDLSAE